MNKGARMDVFIADKLNPRVFSMNIRYGTHELSDVLGAAAQTDSALVESTHFLFATTGIKGGLTQQFLAGNGLVAEQWQAGLSECAKCSTEALPPPHLTKDSLDESAIAMLQAAERYCQRYDLSEITEAVFLLSALGNLTPSVIQLFKSADIDVDGWMGSIESTIIPAKIIQVLPEHTKTPLDLAVFSAGAKKVMLLMQGEAEALGYARIDPRHLALALLTHEGGVSQYGLFQQSISPKKIQEALSLNLKAKARRTRSTLVLNRDNMQPVLQNILTMTGELAGRDHTDQVAECHLLRAFLATDSSARQILEDEQVKIAHLLSIAEKYDPADEEDADDISLADIDTVRQRLKDRLVGQDEAIERILPAVQRMQFGFSVPERPVGVFLFCGQSGSGKTEMAKELARAVYGSEENLIYMEMGQFNSAESMNIFVGAPPGYIGYGEGKLTNGLRDKPKAVVLFDEVEKANPQVLDALLRFLDEGRIDDPAGPVRDGSQCIVILTSNIGANELSKLAREMEGRPDAQATIRARLRKSFENEKFRVEFLNRVDELILFRTLGDNDYTAIAERLLKKNLERLQAEKQVTVNPDPRIAKAIGDYCGLINEGARAAARLIQSVVITPVIDFLVRNKIAIPATVDVCLVQQGDKTVTEPRGMVSIGKATTVRT